MDSTSLLRSPYSTAPALLRAHQQHHLQTKERGRRMLNSMLRRVSLSEFFGFERIELISLNLSRGSESHLRLTTTYRTIRSIIGRNRSSTSFPFSNSQSIHRFDLSSEFSHLETYPQFLFAYTETNQGHDDRARVG